jgi:hypothetical protein
MTENKSWKLGDSDVDVLCGRKDAVLKQGK